MSAAAGPGLPLAGVLLGCLPGVLFGSLLLAHPAGHALANAACGSDLPAPARQATAAGTLQLAFAPRTWPVPVGRHFEMDIVLCPPAGAPRPALTGVDADMPAHRHGMNYRATVRPLGDGRYRAEGLMFHMPGRWRFRFDVNGTELSHAIEVE